MKRPLLVFITVCLLFVPQACTQQPDDSLATPAPHTSAVPETLPELRVSVLGIKKADCIVITAPEGTVVIDCGAEDDADKIFAFLEDRAIRKIDYLILSHLDKDHIGAAGKLIERYDIGAVYQSVNEETSKEYLQYLESSAKRGISPVKLSRDTDIQLGNLHLKLYSSQKMEYENDNDYSIIVEARYGTVKMLFTGDALDERLAEFLSAYSEHVDFLKLPHHGRYAANTLSLIEVTRPAYAVITAKAENDTDPEILDALNGVSAAYYTTGKKTVQFLTDGKTGKLTRY